MVSLKFRNDFPLIFSGPKRSSFKTYAHNNCKFLLCNNFCYHTMHKNITTFYLKIIPNGGYLRVFREYFSLFLFKIL